MYRQNRKDGLHAINNDGEYIDGVLFPKPRHLNLLFPSFKMIHC